MGQKLRPKRNIPAKKITPPGIQKHGATFRKFGEAFQQKNRNRKISFDLTNDRSKYDARLLRRALNGTFGRENPQVWNQLVIGTTGGVKETRKN